MGGTFAEISYSSLLLTSFPILVYQGFYHDFFSTSIEVVLQAFYFNLLI